MEDPKLEKETIAIFGFIPNIFTKLAVISAILTKSLAVGFIFIVVSARNKGPCLVSIKLVAAILEIPLSFSISSKIGFTTVGYGLEYPVIKASASP